MLVPGESRIRQVVSKQEAPLWQSFLLAHRSSVFFTFYFIFFILFSHQTVAAAVVSWHPEREKKK